MRGFKVGHKKVGGRQKGTVNRKTAELLDKAKELGADPFAVLCYYSMRDWKKLGYTSSSTTKVLKDGGTIVEDIISPEMQLNAAKELCQYLYSKKRAVEVSNSEEDGESEGFKIVIQDYSKQDAGA